MDDIGEWSEQKLELLKLYLEPYCKIVGGNTSTFKCISFIDGFSGPGCHHRRTNNEEIIDGSPLLALQNNRFTEFHFVEASKLVIDELQQTIIHRFPYKQNIIKYYNNDCNLAIPEILKSLNSKYDKWTGLVLLDPYKTNINWELIENIGQHKSLDVILNFSIMDIQRRFGHITSDTIYEKSMKDANDFFGTPEWFKIGYEKRVIDLTKGEQYVKIKDFEEKILEFYARRLKQRAGFNFVSNPLPFRNSQNAKVYYILIMSHHYLGNNLIEWANKKFIK